MKFFVWANLLATMLFATQSQALENADIIGQWKLASVTCGNGEALDWSKTKEFASVKVDMVLDLSSVDRGHVKTDISYSFKESFFRENRQKILKSLEYLRSLPDSIETRAAIENTRQSLAEFDKMFQPRFCSFLSRFTYYIRGNVFYRNNFNWLSTCMSPGSSKAEEDMSSLFGHVELRGGHLIITNDEVLEKGEQPYCPNDGKMVFNFTKQ